MDSAIELTTSPGYNGVTHYYMIPTEHLPLLAPLRAIPVIGNPLADLIEPTTKVLVNLGYGDPYHGYSTSYADVPTPFGLFPDVAPGTVFNALVASTQQGIANFSADLHALGLPAADDPVVHTAATARTSWGRWLRPRPTSRALAALPTPAEVVNTAASIISTDYALLLPTADIATSLVTSVPLYDAQLFLQQLAMGNLINAIGYPIAGDVGLGTVAGAVFGLTVIEALVQNLRALQGLVA